MVLAKLHTICGNCGHLFDEPVIEISYDDGESCFSASLSCPSCATMHFFEVDFEDKKEMEDAKENKKMNKLNVQEKGLHE